MSFEWSDVRIEQLKALWSEGLSASKIAAEMSDPVRGMVLSRSAIIGKVHRLGLPGRARAPRPAVVPERPRRVPVRVSVQGKGAIRLLDAKCEPIEMREADAVPLNIGLSDLNGTTCRFPYGDEAPYRFCGHPPIKDSPYCAAHHHITHNEPPREISDEESAKRSAAQKRSWATRKTEAA